jgi:hypothetical protein
LALGSGSSRVSQVGQLEREYGRSSTSLTLHGFGEEIRANRQPTQSAVPRRDAQDGAWWCPWLALTATDRREAVDAARIAVAAWLEVDAKAVEVVAGNYQTQAPPPADR